ncbi:MAG: LysR family transcriptional regulator [Lachnospiraceae bacterium]|nr:LysR family transcriptional regulator [Lachnospiraceae bacterium]
MELRVLKYFVTIAEEGNFTKAAKELHVTQPVLSRQITSLEDELGVQLLERGKRKATLTEAGILFRKRAESMLELAERTEKEMADIKNDFAGEIVIGTAESSAQKIIPDIISSFQKMYPNTRYRLIAGTADQIEEKMDAGAIDIGMLLEPVKLDGYEYIRFPYPERSVVLMRADDILAKKDYLTADDVKNLPLLLPDRKEILQNTEKALGIPMRKLNVIATHNLISNAAFFVEKGLGYAITIEGSILNYDRERFAYVPLHLEVYTNSVLVWKKNGVFNPAVRKFIDYIIMLFEHNNKC